MSVLVTKIYEYKISIGNLMDWVISEMARKCYIPTADPEANAANQYEFSMNEDDRYWFEKYLAMGISEICFKLQPLQKYLEEPYQVDPLFATIRFRLSCLYKTKLLEDQIKDAIGNFICYRWFLMKNLVDIAGVYNQLYQENLSQLKGFGARGIFGRSTADRPYDMGFGAHKPMPYEEVDLVIKDILWGTGSTYYQDLYSGDNGAHLPGSTKEEAARKNKRLPGVTVVGPNEIVVEGRGDDIPMGDMGADKGMVIRGVPTHEVLIRRNNETVEERL